MSWAYIEDSETRTGDIQRREVQASNYSPSTLIALDNSN